MEELKYFTEDKMLIDTIRKISRRVNFAGSERDASHSRFLLEMIEDIEAQLDSNRHQRAISPGA